ncbi:uncharacterized protein G2W53_035493 [Senna tora]|uniref:Uncharacterized protein n=1 Tax=Senna tora TaxID=362788 RepID=A0A834SQK6_9FABA|nr:uncharacterized protein G2W53_035493 [Senna tora]
MLLSRDQRWRCGIGIAAGGYSGELGEDCVQWAEDSENWMLLNVPSLTV